ncbi:nuclear transcription factor Y subunit beta isoform X4 [Contarinia nasturtii]|uniref:nuclear transcription factor Y subunit beta isoform X4 n=1 Tax=Contarinia nasturtii TaxID=265458 RepID=UPI0012D46BF4|nr:nuclear transcription factor Y subunit beta isoform X4 [Contarinia nasturtii]
MIQKMLSAMRHHTRLLLISIALFEVIAVSLAQRVAPGVPPQQYHHNTQYQQGSPQYQQQQNVQYQQYQQAAPQQQYQQPPQHQQQQQQQQFQQPQYQQQQQQPPQQQQQQFQQPQHETGHGHGHAHGSHNGNVLGGNVNEEKEHIQEHMEVPIDTSKMTEQELQFHYFTMHDSDKNNKLDGSELIKSLIHWHEKDNAPGVEDGSSTYTDEKLSEIIDQSLKIMDTNNDGYVSFPEFVKTQQDMKVANAAETP